MAKPKSTPTSRPEVQTIDVVFKCGHEGQRRVIVYPHISALRIRSAGFEIM